MNRSHLMALFGDDPALVAQFVANTLRHMPLQLDSLRQAAQMGDWASVRHTAHDLKSQFAYFGEESLRARAFELEQANEPIAVHHTDEFVQAARDWLDTLA